MLSEVRFPGLNCREKSIKLLNFPTSRRSRLIMVSELNVPEELRDL